ncbi:MAG: BTAD domain-containing putative transcriptional regulator [Chloroflexi bacterium]|nr:BTAD domain-containing putative transcriptional regulator [Chloroflexota bacterium]
MLYFNLLGRLQILLDGEALSFASQRAELLLAYLALNRRPHGREALATLLWDDRTHEQSLSNLRSLLAQLPEPIKPLLTADRKAIYWAEDVPFCVDALEFEQRLAASPTAAETIAALGLYGGPFLAGVTIRESYGLEEWVVVQRERYQQLALRAHQQAAEHALHTRQLELGLHHARALAEIAPFYEAGVRLLLRFYGQMGQKLAAEQAYEQFCHLLAAELGVEPTAETITLHQRIQEMRWPIPHQLPPTVPLATTAPDHLSTLAARLAAPHCRLLTLTSPNTAELLPLAVALADQRGGEYLDGIWGVELGGGETVPSAVGRALAVPPSALLEVLRGRELLLLLHQFDPHDEAAVAWVLEVVESCPAVQLLITAPEPLCLRVEWLG